MPASDCLGSAARQGAVIGTNRDSTIGRIVGALSAKSREPKQDRLCRKAMTPPTRVARPVALFIVMAVVMGCGAAESTQQEGGAAAPSTTPFTVYTHCGVENARIDGQWWHAKPPLYNQDQSGPPKGWGDPHQDGTLTMVATDRAVFKTWDSESSSCPRPRTSRSTCAGSPTPAAEVVAGPRAQAHHAADPRALPRTLCGMCVRLASPSWRG